MDIDDLKAALAQSSIELDVANGSIESLQAEMNRLTRCLISTSKARDVMCASSASLIRMFGAERILKQKAVDRLNEWEINCDDITDDRAVTEALQQHQNTLTNRFLAVTKHRDELYDMLRAILDASDPEDDTDEQAIARQMLCEESDIDKYINAGYLREE